MQKFYLVIFFLTWAGFSNAQNNAQIKGKVFDSERKPLDKATVSIVSEQDSMVITYGLTNDKGEFDLVRIPTNKELSFFISHVSVSSFHKKINLKPNEKLNMDSILMKANSIEEIEITAVPPIRMNGDTLEYKADYFKTRPNATVEELLGLLPGLQVNSDGSIYYQGREVQRVRVNNKDFFSQDLKIATRNLDASLIDVVQVIKDKGESKREILDDTQLPIILNLKMKKEFLKADFGKLYGGAATRDRYESGALINTFRDTLQVSFIGFANNINRTGFDYSELYEHGGMNRSENNQFYSYGTNGLMNQISAGVNINYDIKKKLKANFTYNFGKNDYYNDSKDQWNSFYNEIEEETKSSNNSKNTRNKHEFRAFLRYHIDTTAQIVFTPSLSTNTGASNSLGNADRFRNQLEKIIKSEYQNDNSNKNLNYNQNFYAEKKFKNKWLLSFNHNFSNDKGNSSSNSKSLNYYYLFNDSLINQQDIDKSNSRNLNIDNKLNVQIPISKKANFDFYTQHQYSNQTSTEDLLNKINSDVFINRNDVANNKGISTNRFLIGTKWNFNIVKDLPFSVGMNWYSYSNRFDYYQKLENRLTKNIYWLPELSISYKGINFEYQTNVDLPAFYSIVSVYSNISPTYHNLASPFFENTLVKNYRLRYDKFFTKSKINLFASAGISNRSNSIAQASTYNVENSFSSSQNYQAGSTQVKNFYLSISKNIIQNKNWDLSINTDAYGTNQESYSKVNEEQNFAQQFYGNWTTKLALNYKKAFTFTPMFVYGLNNTRFKFKSENFKNTDNSNFSYGTTLLVHNIKKLRLESSYTVKNQVSGIDNQRQNLHLVNASIYYPILGNGELKLSAFDILNQNISNNFGSFSNNTYYNSTLTLRQYFMLGIVYKFLKTGNK